jgi:phosphoribosylanthranilate isomerase
MFRVKICGVTTADDARMVAAAGADAVGLNFVPGSPRCLTVESARLVAAAIPAGILRIGVFAGMEPAAALAIASAVGLDAIQFHGHLAPPPPGAANPCWDPPEVCRDVAPIPVIRACRLRSDGPATAALDEARGWVAAALAAGRAPAMLLVDAGAPAGAAPASLGGTGHVVDWERFVAAGDPGLPVILAGGLTADNVAAAIAATGATAVDAASGVESAPGRKDPERVEAFVSRALRVLAAGSGP